MRLFGAALMLMVFFVSGAQAAPPTYPVHRLACPVTIDGVVQGDAAWEGVPSMTGFFVLGNGYTNSKQTVARLAWDEEALYVGVVCEEPDAAKLKPSSRDGGDTWAEDSLEIFIHPLPAPQVYQFGVTAGGARGGFEGNPDPLKFQAAAKIEDKHYTIEARFPYTMFPGKPEAGKAWAGNICRNIFTAQSGGDKFTSWAPLESRFLEPQNFAVLNFQAGTLTPAEAMKVTEQLNAAYRGTLVSQVREAGKLGADYVATLKEAAGDAKFGAQAQALLKEWQRIEQINREAERANILDMRAALMKLQELNRDSYDVKYKYLIYRLLAEN